MLNLHCVPIGDVPFLQALSKYSCPVIVIVPDQATLKTEKEIIEALNVDGLIHIEVMSFARLGKKILEQTGQINKKFIDKQGRQMLVSKIILENKDNFAAFSVAANRQSFAALMTELIGEMKQFNISPPFEGNDLPELLSQKVHDISLVFEKYEESLKGKYLDTEDQIDLYVTKIKEYATIKDIVIFIDGFDSYTPKTMKIIEQLLLHAKEVNISVTVDLNDRDNSDYEVAFDTIEQMKNLCEKIGKEINIVPYPQSTQWVPYFENPAAPSAPNTKKTLALPNTPQTQAPPITKITHASNYYTEAQSAASEILRLIRDENLRYKDIAVICNDAQVRGSIIRRVFTEYDIPFFMDKKRSIMHSKYSEFLMSIFDVVLKNYTYEDVFRLIKTGLTPVSEEEGQILENYVLAHRIRGKGWKKPFIYGVNNYRGEQDQEKVETLNEINEIRVKFIEFTKIFENIVKDKNQAKYTSGMVYKFIKDTANLPAKIENDIEKISHELGMEISQIWDAITNTLVQITELLGESEVSADIYSGMLSAGLDAVEIGILPPSMDQVIVGTLQRSRIENIKALFVIGANEDVLPSGSKGAELLYDEEKNLLLEDATFGKLEKQRLSEEKLAILKSLKMPSDLLFISYSASDQDGKELLPSSYVDKAKELYENYTFEKDIINANIPLKRVGNKKSTLSYVSESLRDGLYGENIDDEAMLAYNWYFNKEIKKTADPDAVKSVEFDILKDSLLYENKEKGLQKQQVKSFLHTPERLSPSQLETYSRCPFSYYVRYFIKPEERKIFEIAAPELGEIFHEALREFSNATNTNNSWNDMLDEEKCQKAMNDIVDKLSEGYKEGILSDNKSNQYRLGRIKRVCTKTANAVANHIVKGFDCFKDFYFEVPFGLGKEFLPIEIACEEKIFLEGRIDRVDIFKKGDKSYVKIVDYKSGYESFDVKEAKEGWKLQLLLYMIAALKGISAKEGISEEEKKSKLIPAGAFYFKIDDPMIESDGKDAAIAVRKKFKMDGVVIDDEEVITAIDPDFAKTSEIIPVKNKNGVFLSSSLSKKQLLPKEEFDDLLDEMEQLAQNLCEDILNGNIDVKPKKLSDKADACLYCQYKLICGKL